jgi:hypothetical protein
MANLTGTPKDLEKLRLVHEQVEALPSSCVAAIVKHAIGLLAQDGLLNENATFTLADFDKITDTDPLL